MKQNNKIYDSIIIGAGPAGLSAAIYLKRANIDVLVIEKGAFGGKVNYTAVIDNYLGEEKAFGPDLAFKFYNHAKENDVDIISDDIINVTKDDQLFIIKSNDEEYITKTIIVASGTTDKKLDIINANKFEHHGISYCAVCDGPLYKNKDVAVLGGGNSALEEALYLANITSKVYLIHRRDEFRGDKKVIEQIKNNPKIILKLSLTIEELIGDKSLEQIKLNNGEIINVSALFPYIGQIPNTQFLNFANLCNENGYIIVNNNMDTIIPGLFAAGDVTNQKLKQVVTATSDGAIAATSVIEYLRG